MNKDKTASFIKGFVAVFLVIVLVLAYFIIRNIKRDHDEDPPVGASFSDSSQAADAALHGQCDILLGCTENGSVSFLMRAKFDLDASAVTVYALPLNLPLSHNGTVQTIDQVWQQGGAAALSACVGGYYGDSFDRYFICSADGFSSITRQLGAVQIETEQDVTFIRENIVLNLKAGKHSLYGRDLYNYLTYSAEGTALLENQASVGAAMMRDYLSEKNTEKGEDLFSAIINYADSNISAYDYFRNKDLLEAIAARTDILFSSGGVADYPGGADK